MAFATHVSLAIIKSFAAFYTYLTLPVYYLAQQPSRTLQNATRKRANRVDKRSAKSQHSYYERSGPAPPRLTGGDEKTMVMLLKKVLEVYADSKCFAYKNGNDFDFLSYRQVDVLIDKIAKGLIAHGVKVSAIRAIVSSLVVRAASRQSDCLHGNSPRVAVVCSCRVASRCLHCHSLRNAR